ncbi:MAG: MCP four helix bundle domain-containing protein [Desulfamplus sp.]|nr:MCP four helix bundle domain-containing protein [Desulfamplus sp.]
MIKAFSPISLRSKILYIFITMVSVAIIGSILTLWYTYQMDNLLVTVVEKDVTLYKAIQEMELALANQKGFVTYYLVDGDAKWLESLGQYRAMFQQSYNQALSLELSGEERKSLEAIFTEYTKYIDAKDVAINEYREKKAIEAKLPHDNEISISSMHAAQRKVFFGLLDMCKRFNQDVWRYIKETERNHFDNSERLRIMVFSAILFFMLIGALFFFIIYMKVLEPIRDLAIETGGSPVESSRNEVVSLSHSLKEMIKDYGNTHDELKRSRKHLVQAERMAMVGELAAGVAHTIRNPFTSIKMRLFSLSRSMELSEVQNEDLDVIEEEIGRIDKIVQNFLEFARTPKLSLKNSTFQPVVKSVMTLLEYRLKQHNVNISHTAQPGLPPVEMDPDRIREALLNLITNACEAMEIGAETSSAGSDWISETGQYDIKNSDSTAHIGRNMKKRPPTIVISEKMCDDPELGELLCLSVRDNGPGIPEHLLEKITKPFFTTKEDGSGLGLSIVDRIVREHGGTFSVLCEGEGAGAEFILKLPIKRGWDEENSDH